jgi:hypothetical protein
MEAETRLGIGVARRPTGLGEKAVAWEGVGQHAGLSWLG